MYRKEYVIGVYAPLCEGETLLCLCNDIKEFAKFIGIKYDNAVEMLHLLFTGKTRGVRLYGKICTVEFIKEDPENDALL